MKSIVKSQLTGKWYKLTRDFHSRELKFAEIFIYLSVNGLRTTNNCHLDLLYVGVKEDRNKILRKMSLRIIEKSSYNYLIVSNFIFRKKFKVLLFDEENGILILSDKRMKKISIYSRKYKVTPDVIESYFRKIDFKSSVKIIIEEL
mgnify:FL=1